MFKGLGVAGLGDEGLNVEYVRGRGVGVTSLISL